MERLLKRGVYFKILTFGRGRLLERAFIIGSLRSWCYAVYATTISGGLVHRLGLTLQLIKIPNYRPHGTVRFCNWIWNCLFIYCQIKKKGLFLSTIILLKCEMFTRAQKENLIRHLKRETVRPLKKTLVYHPFVSKIWCGRVAF